MSRLRDVVIVVGDFAHESNRIHRYLNALSRDYDVVRIDDAVIDELRPGELPLDILAASICDLVISQYSGKVFRLLIESRLLVMGFTIAKHLIGRDLNLEFLAVSGGTEVPGIDAAIENQAIPQNLPVNYISESSHLLSIPSHWKICDISDLDDTQAYIRFCEILNTSKDCQFLELSYQPLFSIQNSRSNNTPIFCIPGAGDNIASFTALCMALGTSYSIYGMQPRGLDGRMIPHHSVEAAAFSYLEAIKKVQRKGPIHLIAHSFGGWVAYEIAALLTHTRDHGLSIESITVIDSEVPGTLMRGCEYSDEKIIKNYVTSIELYSKKRLSIQLDDWLDINPKERVRRLHGAMVGIGILPARSSADILQGPYNTFATAFRTFYSPRRHFSGELRLVLAPDEKLTVEQNEQEYQSLTKGWERCVGELKVFLGGGNHMKVLSEPYISEVVSWWELQNHSMSIDSLSTEYPSTRTRQKQGYAVG